MKKKEETKRKMFKREGGVREREREKMREKKKNRKFLS